MVPDSDFELVMIISIISHTVKLDHVRLADPDDADPIILLLKFLE